MENTPRTAAAETNANAQLRGDWDADDTTSVHLPAADAEAILREWGWRYGRPAGSRLKGDHWTSPHGQEYWSTSEALTVAVLSVAHEAAR